MLIKKVLIPLEGEGIGVVALGVPPRELKLVSFYQKGYSVLGAKYGDLIIR